MSKPRVLICHPAVESKGGGNLVAAWAIEALRDEFAVSLCTLRPPDCDALNRSFGTSLDAGDFELQLLPEAYLRLLRWLPTTGALLEWSLTVRWAQDLRRRYRYDVLLSTSNEADFHRPGLQYIHFPSGFLPRPEIEMRLYHRIPGLLWTYRRFCLLAARSTREGPRRNVTLANSAFTAEAMRQTYGVESTVVYPPVPGVFPRTPWPSRRMAAAAIGRLHPGKRWEMAVEIVEEVRRRGHDLSLTLMGHGDDEAYGRRLDALATSRPWFRIERELSREELARRLATHRYGIHAMQDEHFGIAPAELQRAGCITFVHNSGGQVEIVGGDPCLVFDSVFDAADKIAHVIENPTIERELLVRAEKRCQQFTAERFCETLRRAVRSRCQEENILG